MFAETKLLKHLWGETIRTAAYQLNRSPTTAINGEIPVCRFLDKIDLSKLRVFGFKAWAFKQPVSGDKLETRAREVRMMGYGINGYRLWDPKTDDIINSRHVRFDETDYVYEETQNEETEIEERTEEARKQIIVEDENENNENTDEVIQDKTKRYKN